MKRFRARWLLVTIPLWAGMNGCMPRPKHLPAQLVEEGSHLRIGLNNFSLSVPIDIGSIAYRNEVGSPLAKQYVRLDGDWGMLLLRYYPLQSNRDVDKWYQGMRSGKAFERRRTIGKYPAIEMRSAPAGGIYDLVLLIIGKKGILVVSGSIRAKDEAKIFKALETVEIR